MDALFSQLLFYLSCIVIAVHCVSFGRIGKTLVSRHGAQWVGVTTNWPMIFSTTRCWVDQIPARQSYTIVGGEAPNRQTAWRHHSGIYTCTKQQSSHHNLSQTGNTHNLCSRSGCVPQSVWGNVITFWIHGSSVVMNGEQLCLWSVVSRRVLASRFFRGRCL